MNQNRFIAFQHFLFQEQEKSRDSVEISQNISCVMNVNRVDLLKSSVENFEFLSFQNFSKRCVFVYVQDGMNHEMINVNNEK